MQQLRFTDPRFKRASPHGGEHSRRAQFRVKRPLSTRDSMHIVIKSSLAKGKHSFRGENLKTVNQLVTRVSHHYGVKIQRYANSGNHLHLIVHCRNRTMLERWMKILPQRLMFLVTKLTKNTSLFKLIGRKNFFDYRPFSRILVGRRSFRYCANYVEKNILEVEGLSWSLFTWGFNSLWPIPILAPSPNSSAA